MLPKVKVTKMKLLRKWPQKLTLLPDLSHDEKVSRSMSNHTQWTICQRSFGKERRIFCRRKQLGHSLWAIGIQGKKLKGPFTREWRFRVQEFLQWKWDRNSTPKMSFRFLSAKSCRSGTFLLLLQNSFILGITILPFDCCIQNLHSRVNEPQAAFTQGLTICLLSSLNPSFFVRRQRIFFVCVKFTFLNWIFLFH